MTATASSTSNANRPLIRRIVRRSIQAIGVVLLIFLLTAGVLVARFYSAKPTISHNYSSELAAKNAAPPDQRAYPIYRSFSINQKKANFYDSFPDLASVGNDSLPGEPGWEDAQKFAAQFASDLALVRQAAFLPSIGGPYTDADDPIWYDQVTKLETPSAVREPGTPNPSLLAIRQPEQGWCRQASRFLLVDARVALAQGDIDRCHQDLLAMLGIARQAGAEPFLVGRLIHISLVQNATREIRRVLTDSPQAFSELQLASLARALSDATSKTMQPNLDTEKLRFEDWLQRSFTDDGNGDGRLTPQGFADLQSFGLIVDVVYLPSSSPNYQITSPLIPQIMASRKDLHDAYDRLLIAAQHDAAAPRWNRSTVSTDAEFDRIGSTRLKRARFLPVIVFFPEFDLALKHCEVGAMDRDATLTALALEIHRHRTGQFPVALSDLVPSLISQLPIDIWNGKPLKYQVIGGRPLLYSIGADTVDNNGAGTEDQKVLVGPTDVTRTETKDKDWLFLPQIRKTPKVQPVRRARLSETAPPPNTPPAHPAQILERPSR